MRTDDYVVAVEVEAVIPDADPTEACHGPQAVELLRQVEQHAKAHDLPGLQQHGKVYAAVQAA